MKTALFLTRCLPSAMIAMAIVLIHTGCGTTKPGTAVKIVSYPIAVQLSPSLRASSMVIDLVGVNPSGLTRLSNYSMTQYWREGDALRKEVDKVTLSFVDGNTLTNTVTLNDPIWKAWKAKGVTAVLVFSNVPWAEDKPGNQDPRRQILSLNKWKWVDGTAGLSVLVQRSGIEILTQVRPGWENQ